MAERQYAQYLLDMINSLDAEGAKVMNELRNDALKVIFKRLTVNILLIEKINSRYMKGIVLAGGSGTRLNLI